MKQVVAFISKGHKVPLFTLSDSLAAVVRHELEQNAKRKKSTRDIKYVLKRV